MTITKEDLRDFNRFVDEKLSNGGAESLTELAREWEERRDFEKSVADVREGLSDAEAGRVHSVEDAFNQVRKNLGLSK